MTEEALCVQLVGHLGGVLDAVAWVSIDNRCYRYSLFLPGSFVRYQLLSTSPLLRFDLVASAYTSHSSCTESSWRCSTGLADRGYISAAAGRGRSSTSRDDRGYISARRWSRTLLYKSGRPRIHLRTLLAVGACWLSLSELWFVLLRSPAAFGFCGTTVMVVSCPAVAAGPGGYSYSRRDPGTRTESL